MTQFRTNKKTKKVYPIHRKKQHTIYADVPKAGEYKPFTTKADRDRLVRERFEELDLKEHPSKSKEGKYKKGDKVHVSIYPSHGGTPHHGDGHIELVGAKGYKVRMKNGDFVYVNEDEITKIK